MAVNLKKGEKLSLKKEAPSLKRVLVGLGWDARATSGAKFDLDASAFLVTSAGKVRGDHDMVFYGMDKIGGKLITADGAVEHTGDNRTGDGDGDDESLVIDLAKVAEAITRIVVTVTIFEAKKRQQNFGMVSNAFIRLVDADTNVEICRYDLGEDFSTETAVEFGALYRKDGEWKFDAVGQGYTGGLSAMCNRYGIEAEEE